MSEEVKMNYCSLCEQEKPVTDFYVDKRNKSGYSGYCKQCQSAYFTMKAKAVQRTDQRRKELQELAKNSNLTLPTGVSNLEMYNKYLELRKEIDNIEKQHQTSDPKLIINISASPFAIEKQLYAANIPDEEKEEIRKIYKRMRSLYGEMGGYKRKAFGQFVAGEDETRSVLAIKQAEILELFGRFYNATEIYKIVTIDWGFDLNIDALNAFRRKFIDKITELQEQYKREFSDIRLGYKRSRLDELSWLYGTIRAKYQKNECRDDAKQLQSLLEQIRKEVEGDRLTIDGKLQVDIDAQVNFHLQQSIIKDLNITQLVLTRVAARIGINPLYLITRLANSYYSKFNGFGTMSENIYNDEIIPITSLTYNFDEITQQNKAIALREKQLQEVQNIPEAEEVKVLSLKEQLQKKLMEKKELVNEVTDELEQFGYKDDKRNL